MELVFWQNMISIHQRDFLEALAMHESVKKITLVANEGISEQRKNMGWDIPELKNIDVIIAPGVEQVNAIIERYPSGVNVFSGFNVGPLNIAAMKQCIDKKRRIAIMSEPYNLAGKKGFIRKLKFTFDKLRYQDKIDFILAIGREGVQQFNDTGFDKDKIFPWAYFINMPTEIQQRNSGLQHSDGKCRIMYAGRIEEAKGIYRFAAELLKQPADFELDIYGEGDDGQKIRDMYAAGGKAAQLKFFPFLRYEDLLKRYADYEWLVLPSTGKDGWGAVVSEALLNGLKVICSKKAGSSLVIKDGKNGVTFDWQKENDCAAAISKMLSNKGFDSPTEIISEANHSLTGKAGAAYFAGILEYQYNAGKRPDAPWA